MQRLYNDESRAEWYKNVVMSELYLYSRFSLKADPTDDQIEGLKYAMDSLPEPERTAIISHLQNEISIDDLGPVFGTKRDGTKAILNKARGMLTKLPLRLYFTMGFSGAKAHADILNDIREAGMNGDYDTQHKLAKYVYKSDFSLSRRLDNAFFILHIDTLADIMDIVEYKPENLVKRRHIGTKTFQEIAYILDNLNIDYSKFRKVAGLVDVEYECKKAAAAEEKLREIASLPKTDMQEYCKSVDKVLITDIIAKEKVVSSLNSKNIITLSDLIKEIQKKSSPICMINTFGLPVFREMILVMEKLGFTYKDEFSFMPQNV